MTDVIIIGYGKLGSHLSFALKKTGKFRISGIVKNPKSRIPVSAVNSADIIFITTQDSKIRDAVKSLSINQLNLRNKYIYHTSGSLTSAELLPLAKKGAHTGSFHPVQTFESPAKKDAGRFKDVFIAVEGDNKSLRKAKSIAGLLGAKTITLTKRNKIYHHVCCVIASNFLAVLMHQAEEIARRKLSSRKLISKKILKNGFKNLSFFNIYKPLAMQTLENIANKGAVKSLTGPIERNDIETVEKHLKSSSKELLPVYILMGIETVKLSLKKKSIKTSDAASLLKTFDKYLKINKIH
jgi:predicted short-subunit dehydrogenase-like oxidoreductase (DUF2520 family)